MKLLAMTMAALLMSMAAHAEIYRWKDKEGNVIYSDKPQKGAEKVELPGLTSYKSPAIKSSRTTQSSEVDQNSGKYKSLKINNPVNDATIRDNTGRVAVNIATDPALKEGDIIVFDLDGQIFKSDGLNYAFTNVDRGSHTLKVYVANDKGTPLSPVASSQFHMKKTSILNKSKAN